MCQYVQYIIPYVSFTLSDARAVALHCGHFFPANDDPLREGKIPLYQARLWQAMVIAGVALPHSLFNLGGDEFLDAHSRLLAENSVDVAGGVDLGAGHGEGTRAHRGKGATEGVAGVKAPMPGRNKNGVDGDGKVVQEEQNGGHGLDGDGSGGHGGEGRGDDENKVGSGAYGRGEKGRRYDGNNGGGHGNNCHEVDHQVHGRGDAGRGVHGHEDGGLAHSQGHGGRKAHVSEDEDQVKGGHGDVGVEVNEHGEEGHGGHGGANFHADEFHGDGEDRRLRRMEEELKMQGDRMKLLEGMVGAKASDRCDDKHLSRPGAEEAVTKVPQWAEGVRRDALPEQVPLSPALRVDASPTKEKAASLAPDAFNASSREFLPPSSPTLGADSSAKRKAKRARNKINKKRKKAKEKEGSRASILAKTTALLVFTSAVIGGQKIAEGGNHLLAKKGEMDQAIKGIKEGIRAMFDPVKAPSLSKVEENLLKAIFDPATPAGTTKHLSLEKKDLSNVRSPRRTQEACVFCPDGLAVQPDSPIPGGGGFTCGQVLSAAPTLNGALCARAQAGQAFCCPAGATPIFADPLFPVVSSPIVVPSYSPSVSSLPTTERVCPLADNQVCGCEAVGQSDYRGSIHVSAEDGSKCLPWNSDLVKEIVGVSPPDVYPHEGLDSNYCRNPAQLRERAACFSSVVSENGDYEHYCDVPYCDPCSCMPACGEPNLAACACPSVRQAESCCVDAADKEDCKCGYLKEACQKSLENNSTEFCALAQETCCEGNRNPWCGCNLYQQICTASPFKFTCNFAAESCCNYDFAGADSYAATSEYSYAFIESTGAYSSDIKYPSCKCEFFTYATKELGYSRIDSTTTDIMCEAAVNRQRPPIRSDYRGWERSRLRRFYMTLNGNYWFRNNGWAEAASQYGFGEWQVEGSE